MRVVEVCWFYTINFFKNTTGYVFHLGSRVISWASKKQPIVSLSTIKDEYVVATTVACQAAWNTFI